MESGPRERVASPGSDRSWCGWVASASLAAYAVAMHHGMGPPPVGTTPHWYEPTAFLLRIDLLSSAFDSSLRALVCLTLPACLLAAGVFATNRSAIARAVALACVAATMLCVFYGAFAPGPWEFFGWRGSTAIWLTAACVGFAAAAPFLAASWLRQKPAIRVAVYLPFAFAAVALIRNATGTDPALKYSISPWPAVPVFGLEVGALFLVAVFAGVAVAAAGVASTGARRGRAAFVRRGAVLIAGLLVPVGLLGLGAELDMFPFALGAKTLASVVALCAVAIARVAMLGVGEVAGALSRRARWIAVGAALVGAPIVAGQLLALADYHVTRERRAREIIHALDRYIERESLYPDTLEDLVAAGDIEAIPAPAIGFTFLDPPSFRYQSFGTSFLLEFEAPRWVECTYTPPYVEEPGNGAKAEDEPLGEAWSCPSEPPELW